MLYDFTAIIKQRDGKPVPYKSKLELEDDEVSPPLTVALAIVQALDQGATPQGEPLNSADKVKHFLLATRIYSTPAAVELTVEEAALCKKVVGAGYPPLIVGQVAEAIEKSKKGKPKLVETPDAAEPSA